jgi:hypothetical protein
MDSLESHRSELTADFSTRIVDPIYFPVSLIKLTVLSICTFNLYQIVWFHHNWRFVKKREHSKIAPIWRAIYSVIFCYPLLRKINKSAKAANLPTTTAAATAAGWTIFVLVGLFPNPFSLAISIFSFLFLLPAQRTINRINLHLAPNHKSNRFTRWNIAIAIIGGSILILALIGSFLHPE